MRKISRIIAAACAVLCMASCVEEENFLPSYGKMSFKAGAGQTITTKTQYSDVVDNIARIDWQMGDVFSIYCAEAVKYQKGDYKVTNVISSSGSASEAAIEGVGDEVLYWGDKDVEHHIYAVYPSPKVSLYNSDVFDEGKVSGYIYQTQEPLSVTKIGSEGYEAKPNLLSQYMVAKTAMKPTSEGSSVFLDFYPLTTAIEFEIQNDYSTNDYMNVAAVQLLSKNHELNGAFKLDLTEWDTTKGLPATSSEGLTLGSKKVEIDFSSEEKGYLPIARGQKLKFTFFLLPNEDIDDLVFRVVDPEGGYVSTKLAYSNDPTHGNDGITFKRCTKSFVKGVLVPEGVRWTITLAGDLSSWVPQDAGKISFSNPELQTINLVSSWLSGYDEYVEMDGMYEYELTVTPKTTELANTTYVGAEIKDGIQVVSYKWNEDIDRAGANWRLQILDTINHKWVDASVDPSKNPKGTQWVSFDKVEGSAEGYVKVSVIHGNPVNKDELEYKYSTVADHNKVLRSRDEIGSPEEPIDLSAYDIHGNKKSADEVETANCYVINRAGWYAFPLVYGNAYTKGKDFKVSYHPEYTSQAMRYLRQFQNTRGSGTYINILGTSVMSAVSEFGQGEITSPFIEDDISFRYDIEKNLAGKVQFNGDFHVGVSQTWEDCPVTNEWTAFPIWQDTDSPIVTDNASNCFVISKAAAKAKGLALADKCGYVVFHVNKDNLAQGNILIGVNHKYKRYHRGGIPKHDIEDQAWNRLMWSWHIWVTDEEISTVNVDNGQGVKSAVMPVNLGWVDGNKDDDKTITTSYKPLNAKIRIAQNRGNEPEKYSDEIIVKRARHQLSVIAPNGSSPYYQWGRPTPFPRLKNLSLDNIKNTSIIMHSGYSIQADRVQNGATPTGLGCELIQSRMGDVLRSPTKFFGSSPMDVGLALAYECYEQWYCEPFGGVAGVLLCEGYAFCNLWNAQCVSGANETLPTVKTVYDPCPPGFCVPNGDSFGGLVQCPDGTDFDTHKGINFYTSSDKDETIFIPAVGRISRGSVVNLETSGAMLQVGVEGDYWLSSGGATGIFTIASENNSHAMHIKKGDVNGNIDQSSRTQGMSVRPQVIIDWVKY